MSAISSLAVLLAIIIAFNPVNAEWNPALMISQGSVSNSNIYHDSATHVTHIIWCDQDSLSYRSLNPSGELSSVIVLASTGLCGKGFIAGKGDGKKIYVATTGGKQITNSDCGLVPEVYFMESLNNGATWTKPFALGGTVSRKVIGLEQSSTSERLWIFYEMTKAERVSLAFATRANDLADFRADYVAYDAGTKNHIAGTPAVHFGYDGILHLLWNEVLESKPGLLKYIKSSNLGLTWDSLVTIIEPTNIASPDSYSASIVSDTTSKVYMGYHSFDSSPAFFRYSSSKGTNWSSFIEISKSTGGKIVNLAACSRESIGAKVLSMSQTDQGLEFGYIDSDNGTVDYKETPSDVTGKALPKKMQCWIDGEKKLHAQVVLEKEEGEIILVTYFDQLS